MEVGDKDGCLWPEYRSHVWNIKKSEAFAMVQNKPGITRRGRYVTFYLLSRADRIYWLWAK